MPLGVKIQGPSDSLAARVNKVGELGVSRIGFDLTSFQEMNATGDPFTLYDPRSNQQFVITAIRIKAGRDVSNTVSANVTIFEATQSGAAAVDRVLFQELVGRSEDATLTGINILVNEGKFINAKTTDATVSVNVLGFYVDRVD